MARSKLYVGCALTHADEKFRSGVEKLKKNLRAEGYDVLDFLWVLDDDPTPKQVFDWDIGHCVKDCDAFIAICDYPSLGLGYETAEAVNRKKPVLALAHKDSKVTRLIRGAADVVKDFKFEVYGDIERDIVPMVNAWLKDYGL